MKNISQFGHKTKNSNYLSFVCIYIQQQNTRHLDKEEHNCIESNGFDQKTCPCYQNFLWSRGRVFGKTGRFFSASVTNLLIISKPPCAASTLSATWPTGRLADSTSGKDETSAMSFQASASRDTHKLFVCWSPIHFLPAQGWSVVFRTD